MKTKVRKVKGSGGASLSKQAVAAATSHVEAVNALLAKVATPLTPKQRRGTKRFAKGGEPIAALLLTLGTEYAVNVPGLDLSAIESQLDLAVTVQPLLNKARSLAALAFDTALTARGESWRQVEILYSTLLRASKYDPKLQQQLAAAVEFFVARSRRRAGRRVNKEAASSGAPASAASSDAVTKATT